MSDKITILEKQIDKQDSRRNCILQHDIPESKGEVTDDKTICENINDDIITVDDIERSQTRPPEKNPKTSDREIRSICLK